MEQFGAHVVATIRSQEFFHEAEQSRLARAARTGSEQDRNPTRNARLPSSDQSPDDNLDPVRQAASGEQEADTSPQPVHSGSEPANR